jgi:polyhydroxyalkanoate synthesis regulator phasin
MDSIIKDLTKLRDSISDAEKQVEKFKGRKEEIVNQLESEGFKSSEEAKKFVTDSKEELTKLEYKIRSKYKSIKESYEW